MTALTTLDLARNLLQGPVPNAMLQAMTNLEVRLSYMYYTYTMYSMYIIHIVYGQ
jgi:hypothetical protein